MKRIFHKTCIFVIVNDYLWIKCIYKIIAEVGYFKFDLFSVFVSMTMSEVS
jgi:hypothetical protein